MTIEERYANTLHDLAVEIGVDPADLVAQQELVVDGTAVALSLVDDSLGGSVLSACRVGPLPPTPPPGLLRLILQANTLGKPTLGATFGLQHSGDYLVLARRDALDTPPNRLSAALSNLAGTAALWTNAIAQGLNPPAREARALTPS